MAELPIYFAFPYPLIFMLNISDFSTEIQLIHDKHPFRVIHQCGKSAFDFNAEHSRFKIVCPL